MIEPEFVPMLQETLASIHAASDERAGWRTIVSLYEDAIEKARTSRYFSVQNAPRMYLEFNSDYTSDIFKLMETTAAKAKQHFKSLLAAYMADRVSANRLDAELKKLTRHSDIHEELMNYVLAGAQFDEATPLTVEGYTAKQLADETALTPLGAFNYLVYLREEPQKALADLKAKLPRRTVLDTHPKED